MDGKQSDVRGVTEAIRRICDTYGRAFRRVTGHDLTAVEDIDRRLTPREPINLPFYLSPVFESEQRLSRGGDAPVIAVARDISSRGIGFRCDFPIPANQLIAEFDIPGAETVRFLVEIRWSRKQSAHCFLAGARILRILKPDELD